MDVLRKQNIVKTAIVVTRYFGGIKLGAGGLVGAYSGAAADGVKAGKISKKVECALLKITSDYPTPHHIFKFKELKIIPIKLPLLTGNHKKIIVNLIKN